MRTDNTHRILKLHDFDHLFASRKDKAVVLNKFNFMSPNYPETLSEHLFSTANDVDFIARCRCDYFVGNRFLDRECPICHTRATLDMEAMDGKLEYKTWLSCPAEIPNGWLHPVVYNVLNNWLRAGGKKPRRYLEEILDPRTPLSPELVDIVDGKGFDYFYKNFDRLIDWFSFHYKPTASKPNVPNIRYFLMKYRNILFCHYLPVLSSSLHPIVMGDGFGSRRRRFVDQSSQFVLAAASALSYLAFSNKRYRRDDEVDVATWEAYKNHMSYLTDKDCGVATRQLSKKKSLPRQHIFGSRLHLTVRGVIVPLSGAHECDEIHLPWSSAVNLLRPHIRGRLMRKYGMSLGQAATRHRRALSCHDKLIETIMNDLIAECPYKGLPCLFNRNPSIRTGSTQLLFITKIKQDVDDKTIEFSVLVATGPNADGPV